MPINGAAALSANRCYASLPVRKLTRPGQAVPGPGPRHETGQETR